MGGAYDITHGTKRRVPLRLGLLFGGTSGEHEVSIQSAASIFDALDTDRYTVVPIGIDRDGIWRMGSSRSIFVDADDVRLARIAEDAVPVAAIPDGGRTRLLAIDDASELARIDVFFPIVHGTFGEDGSIQGMLRMLGTPYVGPGLAASVNAMDKDLSKRLLRDAGLTVARHQVLRRDEPIDLDALVAELRLPLFVKPANLGSSVGIRRATDTVSLAAAVEEAFRYDTKVVVEESIAGREIECAVLGNEHPESSLPGEVRPRDGFYSYEAKYVDASGADLFAPANLDDDTVDRVQAVAIEAYRALECEGMARVDLFLRDDGAVVVNEINTLPGFTSISMYPKLWSVSGLPYPRLLDQLIDHAMERHARDSDLSQRPDTIVYDDARAEQVEV